MPFKHGEWYWLRVTGPDGIAVFLGKFCSWGYVFRIPDDADTDYPVEPDGRLHKWRILSFCKAKPPGEAGGWSEFSEC